MRDPSVQLNSASSQDIELIGLTGIPTSFLAISIWFWIDSSGLGTNSVILNLADGASSTKYYNLRYQSATARLRFDVGNSNINGISSSVVTDTWMHFFCYHHQDSQESWLNGVLQGSLTHFHTSFPLDRYNMGVRVKGAVKDLSSDAKVAQTTVWTLDGRPDFTQSERDFLTHGGDARTLRTRDILFRPDHRRLWDPIERKPIAVINGFTYNDPPPQLADNTINQPNNVAHHIFKRFPTEPGGAVDPTGTFTADTPSITAAFAGSAFADPSGTFTADTPLTTSLFAGSVGLTGSFSAATVLAEAAFAGTADPDVTGTFAANTAIVTSAFAGTAQANPVGTFSASTPLTTADFAGTQTLTGSFSASTPLTTAAFTGAAGALRTGSFAADTPSITAAFTGSEIFTGSFAASTILATSSFAGIASANRTGSFAADTPLATADFLGTSVANPDGVFSAIVPLSTASFVGSAVTDPDGAFAATVSLTQASFNGGLAISGSFIAVIPIVTADFVGTQINNLGTFSATVPLATAEFIGVTSAPVGDIIIPVIILDLPSPYIVIDILGDFSA